MRCLAVCTLLFTAAIPQTQTAEVVTDLTNRGVAAFRTGRYADAAEDFRRALGYGPTPQLHQYLGVTYAAQIVPGLETPQNVQLADAAIAQFEAVLREKPDDKLAVEQEAAVYRNIGRLDEAKVAERKALQVDPGNAEVPYTIGVIDWQQAQKNATAALAKANLKDDGVGNSGKGADVCAALQTQNAELVADAIKNLTRAIELKPNYADAMTYLALVYRRRADLHCFDPVSVRADVDLADSWTQQTKDARAHPDAAAP